MRFAFLLITKRTSEAVLWNIVDRSIAISRHPSFNDSVEREAREGSYLRVIIASMKVGPLCEQRYSVVNHTTGK